MALQLSPVMCTELCVQLPGGAARDEVLTQSSPLSVGWNVDVMAGAVATILDNKMEAAC